MRSSRNGLTLREVIECAQNARPDLTGSWRVRRTAVVFRPIIAIMTGLRVILAAVVKNWSLG